MRATLRAIGGRPTLGFELGVLASWAALAATMEQAGAGAAAGTAMSSSDSLWLCTFGAAGTAPNLGGGGGGVLTSGPEILAAGVPNWGLMATAMMLPTALPAVQHVGANSLYWRRRRSMVEFALVFVGIWIAFGAAASGLLASLPPTDPALFGAALLTLAAVWQLTPFKRRALWACHQGRTLPPHGWRATLGVVRFGLLNGGACLASCWALMLTMAAAGPAKLVWMAAVTAIAMVEKLSLKQGQTRRRIGVLLAAASLGWLASAALG